MTAGFVAAGLTNIIGILVLSRAFTNEVLFNQDPAISRESAALILLGGLALIAIARSYQHVPWLVLVFALNKAFFAVLWVRWLVVYGARLGALWEVDLFAGLFYSAYGIVDLGFASFMAWVCYAVLSGGADGPAPRAR